MDALYKAKDIDTGEWVEGNLFVLNGIPYIKNEYETVHIDDETICFIFYFDSQTGRRIWENDIFEFDDQKYVLQYFVETRDFIGVSITSDKVLVNDITNIIAYCKIIGNIFDDFDRLTEGSEKNVD